MPTNDIKTTDSLYGSTVPVVHHYIGDQPLKKQEAIICEAPLELRVGISNEQGFRHREITMRTPGDDEALVIGMLFTGGIIQCIEDIIHLNRPSQEIIEVKLDPKRSNTLSEMKPRPSRQTSCGLCGAAHLEELSFTSRRLPWSSKIKVPLSLIYQLPTMLRRHQSLYTETGGTHGALALDGERRYLASAEDIGRHNALDKLIGSILQIKRDVSIIALSSRISFEMVQKAAMIGCPILVGIGAVSTMAVSCADTEGITLAGWLKDHAVTLYTHPERVVHS